MIIKVVCCCPEKIRMMLICKGVDIIKCIRRKKSPLEKSNGAVNPMAHSLPPPPETEKKKKPTQQPPPLLGYPLFYTIGVYFKPCYEGHGGRRPCHHGYGIPCQPPSYDGYVRLVPSNDGPYGNWPSGCCCNRCYGCRCEFLIEENPTCPIN